MELIVKIFIFVSFSSLLYLFITYIRNHEVTNLLLNSIDKITNEIIKPAIYKNIDIKENLYDILIIEKQNMLVWNPLKWNKTKFEDIIDMKLYNELRGKIENK